jgi:hypothetical protein
LQYLFNLPTHVLNSSSAFYLEGFILGFPTAFCWLYLDSGALFLGLLLFFSILFKGNYPSALFNFQLQLMRWQLRVKTRLLHLADGYPLFGLEAQDKAVQLEVALPPQTSRLLTLVRLFFGGLYVGIPHYFILFFRLLWGFILSFLAFWSVLFTKRYPVGWHRFWVETLRWHYCIRLYLSFMVDTYPPFNGKPER